MKILAIETSCDDTGIAILEYDKTGQPKILADLVSSQVKIHAKWGGVVPMLAKREHQRNLAPLLKKALRKAKLLKISKSQFPISNKIPNSKLQILNLILNREPELLKKLLPFLKKYTKPDIDYIAVTAGPGLEPALWVGVNCARALSFYWNIPLLPINHIEGHLTAAFAAGESHGISNDRRKVAWQPRCFTQFPMTDGKQKSIFPALCLVVSGGHTQLILIKKIGNYKIIGETRDDAAGEAFDKAAKMLGLGYPGGSAIAAEAAKFKSKNLKLKIKELPRPMLHSGDFDFSFSGLKTALLYQLQKMTKSEIKELTPALAAEFQQAAIDVLKAKTLAAAKAHHTKTICLAGGVAANLSLRTTLAQAAAKNNFCFLIPPPALCADNAAMIGLTAFSQSPKTKLNWLKLKAAANWRVNKNYPLG
ncbi:MAG: tRNA (adenosine(37)-N6)-threonylcarbamoyltransferase complex transferase subunit TsaD [Patescibacteria group bacterium]